MSKLHSEDPSNAKLIISDYDPPEIYCLECEIYIDIEIIDNLKELVETWITHVAKTNQEHPEPLSQP